MRTIVDIPDSQIKYLDEISKEMHVSRAEIIRQAISGYIDNIERAHEIYNDAFGILKDKNIDNISYQNKVRSEWGK